MQEGDLEALLAQIRACRICWDAPLSAPLPHEPRPVLRPSATARIAICSQAPGVRVHASGEADGSPFLAMEYLAGQSVAGLVKRAERRGTPVPAPIAWRAS